ncbi:MAG: hypothetical protein PHN94_03275 [Bacteroidales bacterium]|jgi:hypothetical protein|nr:hypothetical protein [Bacteroidales bacterium]
MERFFILALIISVFHLNCNSQNILRNGDFEDVVQNDGDLRIYLDTFYAKHWFQPTDCSVDIYRDHSICNTSHVMNMLASLDFCINTKSGNYSIGFCPIRYDGYMEHLSGVMTEPLKSGITYEVSFSVKYYYEVTIAASKGIGFKMSETPNIFSFSSNQDGKLQPFYDMLFETQPIFADFQLDEYIIDTTWRTIKTEYIASGGEMFITFGRFSYENDKKIKRQFKKIRSNMFVGGKTEKIISKNRSLVIKNFNNEYSPTRSELFNYYFIDDIKIIEKH